MLLSNSHNFLFVHVPKTAGSSLHMTLEQLAEAPKRTFWNSLTRRLPVVERPGAAHFRVHETAGFIRRKLSPEVFDRFISFAVVRNPYDHAVSHFEYMRQYRSKQIARQFADMSFADYLGFRIAPKRPFDRQFARLPDQSHFLVDRKGKILLSTILKFETLAADYRAITERLNITDLELVRINQTVNRSDKVPFQSYYSDETEALVQKIYARDFENFGYARALPK